MYSSTVCFIRDEKRQTGRNLTSGVLVYMSSPPPTQNNFQPASFRSNNISAVIMVVLASQKAHELISNGRQHCGMGPWVCILFSSFFLGYHWVQLSCYRGDINLFCS